MDPPQVLGLGVEAGRLRVQTERGDQGRELGSGAALAVFGLDEIEQQLAAVLPDLQLVLDASLGDVLGAQTLVGVSMLPGEQTAEAKQGSRGETDTEGRAFALHEALAPRARGQRIIGGLAGACTDRKGPEELQGASRGLRGAQRRNRTAD